MEYMHSSVCVFSGFSLGVNKNNGANQRNRCVKYLLTKTSSLKHTSGVEYMGTTHHRKGSNLPLSLCVFSTLFLAMAAPEKNVVNRSSIITLNMSNAVSIFSAASTTCVT